MGRKRKERALENNIIPAMKKVYAGLEVHENDDNYLLVTWYHYHILFIRKSNLYHNVSCYVSLLGKEVSPHGREYNMYDEPEMWEEFFPRLLHGESVIGLCYDVFKADIYEILPSIKRSHSDLHFEFDNDHGYVKVTGFENGNQLLISFGKDWYSCLLLTTENKSVPLGKTSSWSGLSNIIETGHIDWDEVIQREKEEKRVTKD